MLDILVLGAGPAGLTAAIYAQRAGVKTLIVGGTNPGGQLAEAPLVENFPGFPKPIPGLQITQAMIAQAQNLGVKIIWEKAKKLKLTFPFVVETESGRDLSAQSVVVATGLRPRFLGLSGEKQLRGRGVSLCATCDGAFFKNKKVAVVGGGDSALKEALYLANLASRVYLIHRREHFRGFTTTQKEVLARSNIVPLFNTQIIGYLGKKRLRAIRLQTWYRVEPEGGREDEVSIYPQKHQGKLISRQKDSFVWELPIEGVFLAIGHLPNTEFLPKKIKRDPKGYLLVNNQFQTTVEGIFAAGDIVAGLPHQAIVAAGSGAQAALGALEWLRNRV